jgi:large subunit ribosomal protein L25
MAETFTLVAQPRQEQGSRAARRLRSQGKLPAVIYGHKEETVPVTVPLDEFQRALRHGARLVSLQTNGKTETTLIREVQWDFLGQELMHVDFARVSADERIKVDVRLEIRGTAPGVTGGGILDQPMHELHIECLAVNVPESIRVNVGNLQLDQAIHVKDLELPPGVKALTDPDAVVVHVVAPRGEEEETAATPGAGEQAEPEVIRREKAEEEAE